ncbi:hypothetical protein QBC40DRAFT_325751 [Triangularia verruculosa]|uniref:RRM domain-containing protein n=1 Tax=Triangularia verruculosa TaxID=2587418 RepID=A0AAN7AZV9_9PEZI|nr:hypothetical protein QBC40DRAFT_325751 [Triangularia verruculosa]
MTAPASHPRPRTMNGPGLSLSELWRKTMEAGASNRRTRRGGHLLYDCPLASMGFRCPCPWYLSPIQTHHFLLHPSRVSPPSARSDDPASSGSPQRRNGGRGRHPRSTPSTHQAHLRVDHCHPSPSFLASSIALPSSYPQYTCQPTPTSLSWDERRISSTAGKVLRQLREFLSPMTYSAPCTCSARKILLPQRTVSCPLLGNGIMLSTNWTSRGFSNHPSTYCILPFARQWNHALSQLNESWIQLGSKTTTQQGRIFHLPQSLGPCLLTTTSRLWRCFLNMSLTCSTDFPVRIIWMDENFIKKAFSNKQGIPRKRSPGACLATQTTSATPPPTKFDSTDRGLDGLELGWKSRRQGNKVTAQIKELLLGELLAAPPRSVALKHAICGCGAFVASRDFLEEIFDSRLAAAHARNDRVCQGGYDYGGENGNENRAQAATCTIWASSAARSGHVGAPSRVGALSRVGAHSPSRESSAWRATFKPQDERTMHAVTPIMVVRFPFSTMSLSPRLNRVRALTLSRASSARSAPFTAASALTLSERTRVFGPLLIRMSPSSAKLGPRCPQCHTSRAMALRLALTECSWRLLRDRSFGRDHLVSEFWIGVWRASTQRNYCFQFRDWAVTQPFSMSMGYSSPTILTSLYPRFLCLKRCFKAIEKGWVMSCHFTLFHGYEVVLQAQETRMQWLGVNSGHRGGEQWFGHRGSEEWFVRFGGVVKGETLGFAGSSLSRRSPAQSFLREDFGLGHGRKNETWRRSHLSNTRASGNGVVLVEFSSFSRENPLNKRSLNPVDRNAEFLRHYHIDRKSIYVGDIPLDATENEMFELFSDIGEVIKVNLVQRHTQGLSPASFVLPSSAGTHTVDGSVD